MSLQCYEQALKENPNSLLILNGKGINLLYLGRIADALEFYEKALKKDQNSFISWNGKAICLKSLGRNAEALECHRKATEMYHAQGCMGRGKTRLMYNSNSSKL
jgi:tetratricopeptide (TPR) repeat protein